MTMDELTTLGAPPLPEGYFYRVLPVYVLGWAGHRVELRQHRKRWGSRRVDYVLADVAEGETAFSAIVDACQRLVMAERERLELSRRFNVVAHLFGDHQ